jgi:capsular polysaccharide biosynthesis protein
VTASLEAFGIEPLLTAESVLADRRVLVDHRGTGVPRPDDVELLRTTLAHDGPETPQGMVYVSRAADSRALHEEVEVERWLEGMGYAVLRGDSIPPWADQIRLFRDAGIVVGPHGAGLSNMIFCRPGTLIVELLSAGGDRPSCFELLAETCGHRYRGVMVGTEQHPLGDAALAVAGIAQVLRGSAPRR